MLLLPKHCDLRLRQLVDEEADKVEVQLVPGSVLGPLIEDVDELDEVVKVWQAFLVLYVLEDSLFLLPMGIRTRAYVEEVGLVGMDLVQFLLTVFVAQVLGMGMTDSSCGFRD